MCRAPGSPSRATAPGFARPPCSGGRTTSRYSGCITTIWTISDQARILGIHKVLERVSEDQQKFAFPVFICGDFNSRSDSETIRYCENYADFPIVELNKGCGLTCHNYGQYKMGDPYDHIDYIYVNKATADKPFTVTVWTDCRDGIWLSDHYPICAEVELGAN